MSSDKSQKNLTKGKNRTSGRNSQGKLVVRHRGGGHKRKERVVDFDRTDKEGITGKVESIDYDPNRTADIAKVLYEDGERRYIIAPEEMDEGDEVITKEDGPLEVGNRVRLKNIPSGIEVYNVELKPGKGGQLSRSAGTSLQVLANEEGYTHLRMPSDEIRKVPWNCWGSIGSVSNAEHSSETMNKAGDARHRGERPEVRGAAMGAHDHPGGGGEGGQQTWGSDTPKDVYGNKTKGKTRKNKRSDDLIIKRRNE
ncbi:MAG: 50S ribosomal protein L2 [Candidatus Magasanikbacteria bacterium]